MNVCYEGYCICDAAEWEGDTNCEAYYGSKESYYYDEEDLDDRRTGPPAYYYEPEDEWYWHDDTRNHPHLRNHQFRHDAALLPQG